MDHYSNCSKPKRPVIGLSGALTRFWESVEIGGYSRGNSCLSYCHGLNVSLKTADLYDGFRNGVRMAKRCHYKLNGAYSGKATFD